MLLPALIPIEEFALPSTASMAPARRRWRMRWRRWLPRKGRPAIRASVDDFHNPQSLRYARGRYSPDGFYLDSYDYDSFRRLLLEPLSPGGSGQYAAKRLISTTTSRSIWIRNRPSRGGADRRRHLSAPSRVAVLLGPFNTSESRFRRLAPTRRGARPKLRCDRSQLAAASALCRRPEAIPRRMCARAAGRYRDRL